MALLALVYFCKALLAATALLLVSFFAYYVPAGRRPRNFPPGPPGLPVIGNLHQLPLKKTWLQFNEWQKQYGPVMGLKFGPLNVVVLSSYKPLRDLYDKRGNLYSSRPDSYVATELATPKDCHILFTPYGQAWRALRKGASGLLNVANVDEMLPLQLAESSQTMYDIMQSPDQWFRQLERFATAVILAAVFGLRGKHRDDQAVERFYEISQAFGELLAVGGTPPVDAFTFLKYIPEFLTPYKARAKALKKGKHSYFAAMFERAKRRMNKPDAAPCYMQKLLEKGEKNGLTDEQIVWVGGIFIEAGSETSSMTAQLFVLAMTAFPEVFKKAQQEVDKVCGDSASPTPDDFTKLPYLHAVMMEIFRWMPPGPGGIPHMLTQDDWYDGYFFPKGTLFFSLAYAIQHDPAEFDRPDDFLPERWLDNQFGTKYIIDPEEKDHRRTTYVFSASRRVCPGQHMAQNSLMLNMAKMTWAFNIKAHPDHPPKLDPRDVYGDGFTGEPHPFPAVFEIRSAKHREVVERDYKEADEFLRRYED